MLPSGQLGGTKRGAGVLPSLTNVPAKRVAVDDPAAAVAQLRAQIHAATQHSTMMRAEAHSGYGSAAAHMPATAPAAPVVAGGPLASVLPAGHGGQSSHSAFVSGAPPSYSDGMAMPDSLVGPPSLHLHSDNHGATTVPGPAGVPVVRGHSLASTGMSLPLPAHSAAPGAATGGGGGRALDQDTHDIAEALASLGSRTPNSSVLPAQNAPPLGHGSMPPPALSSGHPMHMPTAAHRGVVLEYGDRRAMPSSAAQSVGTLHGATTAGAGGIVTTTTPAPLSGAMSAPHSAGLPHASGSGSIGALAAQVQQLAAAMAQTQTMLQAQTVSHSNGAGGTAQSVNSGGGSVPPTAVVVPQQPASLASGGGSGAGAGQSAAMARAAAATAAEAVVRALGITGRGDIVRSAVEQALSVVSAMYGGADALTPEAASAPPVMRTSAGMDTRGGGVLAHRVGGIVQLPASMPAVSGGVAFSPPPPMAKSPLPGTRGTIGGHTDAPAGDSTSVMVAPGEIGGPHGSGGARRSPVMPTPGTTSTPSGMPPPPGSMGTLPTGQAAVGEVPPPAPSTDSAGPSTGPTAEQAAAGAAAAAGAPGVAASHPSGSSFSGHSSTKQGALRYYAMAAPAGHLPQQGTANINAMAAASVAAASRRMDHVAPLPVEGTGGAGGGARIPLNITTLQQHALATQATEESAALQHVSASVTGAGEEYAAAQRLSGAVAVGDSLSQPGGLRTLPRQRGAGGFTRSAAPATHSNSTVYHGRQVHSSTPTLPAMSPAATTATTVPAQAPAPAAHGSASTPPAHSKPAEADAAPVAAQRSVPGTPELSRQERQLVALRESGLRLPSDVGPGAAANGTVGQAAAVAAADGTGPAPALDNMSFTSGHRSMYTGSLLGGQSGVGGGKGGAGRDYSGSDTVTSAVAS